MPNISHGFSRGLLPGLVIAFAAGAGQAQSSVQVFGTVDLSVVSRQLSGDKRVTQLANGMMTTSFFGVRGREDLGAGWHAVFDLQSFIRADTGDAGRAPTDPYFARSAIVGLEGPGGALRLGRQATPGFTLGIRSNPFGGATGTGPFMMQTYMPSATQPMFTGQGATDAQWSNALSYTSPAFGGFSLSVIGAPGEGATGGRRVGASLNYASGALAGGVVVERVRGMSLNAGAPTPAAATAARPSFVAADSKMVAAGASYDLRWAKLFGQAYRTTLNDAAANQVRLDTSQLGALLPAGPGQVLVSWAHTAKEQTAAPKLSRDTWALGYDYLLSKRTDLYVVLLQDKVTHLNRGTSVALGMRHSF